MHLADIPAGAQHILQTLAQSGYEAYFVGGCVRDLLRGVPPHDPKIDNFFTNLEIQFYFR